MRFSSRYKSKRNEKDLAQFYAVYKNRVLSRPSEFQTVTEAEVDN